MNTKEEYFKKVKSEFNDQAKRIMELETNYGKKFNKLLNYINNQIDIKRFDNYENYKEEFSLLWNSVLKDNIEKPYFLYEFGCILEELNENYYSENLHNEFTVYKIKWLDENNTHELFEFLGSLCNSPFLKYEKFSDFIYFSNVFILNWDNKRLNPDNFFPFDFFDEKYNNHFWRKEGIEEFKTKEKDYLKKCNSFYDTVINQKKED